VQPHVHLCRIAHQFRRATQLRGQLLARREAAVDVEELEQVDDGGPPVQLLRVSCRALLQLCDNINEGDLPGRWWCGGTAPGLADAAVGGGEAVGAPGVLPMPSFSRILLKNPMAISLRGWWDGATRLDCREAPPPIWSILQING
jgi:hypothetical protein